MQEGNLTRELEQRVEELGFELVELERAGSTRRPVLRLKIDRPDSTPESGVTLDDCSRVSRDLEAYIETHRPEMGERYVLEVSSPGVERPLVRSRDFKRFRGREITLQGTASLADRSRRLEGVLLGLVGGEEGEERVALQLADGDVVEIPRSEISKANLVFRWGGERRSP